MTLIQNHKTGLRCVIDIDLIILRGIIMNYNVLQKYDSFWQSELIEVDKNDKLVKEYLDPDSGYFDSLLSVMCVLVIACIALFLCGAPVASLPLIAILIITFQVLYLENKKCAAKLKGYHICYRTPSCIAKIDDKDVAIFKETASDIIKIDDKDIIEIDDKEIDVSEETQVEMCISVPEGYVPIFKCIVNNTESVVAAIELFSIKPISEISGYCPNNMKLHKIEEYPVLANKSQSKYLIADSKTSDSHSAKNIDMEPEIEEQLDIESELNTIIKESKFEALRNSVDSLKSSYIQATKLQLALDDVASAISELLSIWNEFKHLQELGAIDTIQDLVNNMVNISSSLDAEINERVESKANELVNESGHILTLVDYRFNTK